VEERDLTLSVEQRQALRALLEHPGWRVLTEVVLPARVQDLALRMTWAQYTSLDQVYAHQAQIRAIRELPKLAEAYAK